MTTNYSITLDTQKSGFQTILDGCMQGDTGTRRVVISLTDGRAPVEIPADCTVTLWAALPDGSVSYSTCTVEEGRIHHTFRTSETALPGDVCCEVRLTAADGRVLTAPRFKLRVGELLQNDGAVEAEDAFSALTDALVAARAAQAATAAAKDAARAAEAAAHDARQAAGERPLLRYPKQREPGVTEDYRKENEPILRRLCAYGGDAALLVGGETYLLCGTAQNATRHSFRFRREATEAVFGVDYLLRYDTATGEYSWEETVATAYTAQENNFLPITSDGAAMSIEMHALLPTHITAEEREQWARAAAGIAGHAADSTVHVTAEEREKWNSLSYVSGTSERDVLPVYTKNSFWNISGATVVLTSYDKYMAYEPIPVQPGEVYTLHIYAATSAKQAAVTVVDSGYRALYTNNGAASAYNDLELTVPEGGAYLLLTSYSGYTGANTCTLRVENPLAEDLRQLRTLLAGSEALVPNLAGKRIAVLGDSISTHGNSGSGANAVEITVGEADVGVPLRAYLTKQDVDAGLTLGGHTFTAAEIGTEVAFTPSAGDIGKQIGLPSNYNANSLKVWWQYLTDAFGCEITPVCWSGASVTDHEASSQTYMTAHAFHPAQIRKCGKRLPGTMEREAPDYIILCRGVNDFSHSPRTRLTPGYFDGADWEYPATDLVGENYGFLEGIAKTVEALRAAYPASQILLCTLGAFKRVNASHFPVNNGYDSLPAYNKAIREAADFFGCGLIDFAKDGITFENCYPTYLSDSAETPTHPNAAGHAMMGRKAVADLRNYA